MPPITMPSVRFRQQLLRSRLLYIDRAVTGGVLKLSLSTPVSNRMTCTLGLSNNLKPKLFSDPFGVIRLVDSWGFPEVAIPLDVLRSTTEITEVACEKISDVLRNPRTRSKRGAGPGGQVFPRDWGPIGAAIFDGQNDQQITENTGLPLGTVRFIRAQLGKVSGGVKS